MRLPVLIFTLLAVLAPALAPAAIAPRTKEELTAGAAVIVTGRVAGFTVTSRVHGTLEIKLEVASVVKGGGVKAGDTLRIASSAVSLKAFHPPVAGPQGLDPLPKKGDVVTAYLRPTDNAGGKNGVTYSPLMPNGILKVEEKEEAPKTEAPKKGAK